MLRREDDPGHHEDEHGEVGGGENRLLVAAEEGAIDAKAVDELVGPQQAQRPKDAQEADALDHHGSEERHHGRDVGPGRQAKEFASPLPADDETGQEVEEHDDAEDDIQPLHQRQVGQERRGDDEQDGDDVEDEQAVAEAVGTIRVAVVEFPKAGLELGHASACADDRSATCRTTLMIPEGRSRGAIGDEAEDRRARYHDTS